MTEHILSHPLFLFLNLHDPKISYFKENEMSTNPVVNLRTSADWSPLVCLPIVVAIAAFVPGLLTVLNLITPIPGMNMTLFFTFSLIALVGFSALGIAYMRKLARRQAADLVAAEIQIGRILAEKYGVRPSEPSVSIHASSGTMSVTRHGIRAKNANGEDVLASIRLTDNNTDLVAFSNGKEFERLDQLVSN